MKRLITTLTLCTLVLPIALAQKDSLMTDEYGMIVIDHSKDDFKTVLGSGGSHGGYISFDLLAGQTKDNQNSLEIGGRLGWIMNHSFTFGLAGYGFTGSIKQDVTLPNENAPIDKNIKTYNLGGGYGGLFIEPIIFPKQPVHVSFPIFLGVGGIGYYQIPDYTHSNFTYDYGAYENDVVTVLRPSVDIEFNITRFFRLGLSANYRFVNNLELTKDASDPDNIVMLDSDYLNGFNYGFSIKFGWF